MSAHALGAEVISRPSRRRYSSASNPSMVAARVAGVPRPFPAIASRKSSSSISLPAPSIALSSVASVNRAGGRVSRLFTSISAVFTFSWSSTGTSAAWPSASCSSRP